LGLPLLRVPSGSHSKIISGSKENARKHTNKQTN
jgi:hypothetical protein